ncbi:hypothetical protein JVU11DRAFT_5600 [Chiua virens]|nr:hypothetical protein JVU11DRAFT_5600 [Chiua virens]
MSRVTATTTSKPSGLLPRPILPERHEFLLPATIGGVPVSFKCPALRYPVSQRGITLILNHGLTGHKELYHPAIIRLLSHQDSATYDLREIWTMDLPNHGEAALLNRRLLDDHKQEGARKGSGGVCTVMDFAVYLNAFLTLPRFRGHDMIGFGHSGGCAVWVQTLTKFAHAYPNALILSEPTLMFPGMSPDDPRSLHGAANVRGARVKRDTWSSRTEFKKWVTKSGRSIWARWDPRVFDIFVEHGLEEVTVEGKGTHITPRLRKEEESFLYACSEHTVEPSQFASMCKAFNGPGKRGVHVVWAEYEEFISKNAKMDILDAAEHRIATQRTIMGSGHLIPQLKPDALGDTMHELLGSIGSGTRSLL